MRKIALLLSIVLLLVILTSCAAKPEESLDLHPMYTVIEIHPDSSSAGLCYHEDTKIVYIYSNIINSSGQIVPYISENGNFCKFVNGNIKEVK